MLDTNLSFEKDVLGRAKSSANLRKSNITKKQILDAIANTRTMAQAAAELGESESTVRRKTSAAERKLAMARRDRL